MANNPNYKYFKLSNGEAVQKKLEQSMLEARRKGYSVVEIARTCGHSSATYVHRVLVKHGLLPQSKRGKKPGGLVIPPDFAKKLKRIGLSLSLWCAGWGLREDDAIDGLKQMRPAFMAILKRDFPNYFMCLTGIDPSDFLGEPPKIVPFSAVIEMSWSGLEKIYIAQIKDLGIYACGPTPQQAAYTALAQKKMLASAQQLEELPPRRPIV